MNYFNELPIEIIEFIIFSADIQTCSNLLNLSKKLCYNNYNIMKILIKMDNKKPDSFITHEHYIEQYLNFSIILNKLLSILTFLFVRVI
jgi:hypothetical protein